MNKKTIEHYEKNANSALNRLAQGGLDLSHSEVNSLIWDIKQYYIFEDSFQKELEVKEWWEEVRFRGVKFIGFQLNDGYLVHAMRYKEIDHDFEDGYGYIKTYTKSVKPICRGTRSKSSIGYSSTHKIYDFANVNMSKYSVCSNCANIVNRELLQESK